MYRWPLTRAPAAESLNAPASKLELQLPRFFFNIQDGQDFLDQDGTELSGPAEAREQAVIVAGTMLRDNAKQFWNHGGWRLVVFDENGDIVCGLRFTAEDQVP